MTFENNLLNPLSTNCFLLILLFSLSVTSCKEDEVLTPQVEYLIPSYAQGYRLGMVKDCEWLECIHPSTQKTLVRVVRDSSAFDILSNMFVDGVAHIVISEKKKLATLSTTHVALINQGAGLEYWAGGAFISYLQNEEALQMIDNSKAYDLGGVPEFNKEKCLAINPSAVLIYPYGDPLNNLELGIPVVPILEYLESTPLGRTEWMCAIGWMVGEHAKAKLAFSLISKEYEHLKSLIAQTNSARPVVFTGSVREGKWSAPGGGSLVARFIEDAGGEYLFRDGGGLENLTLDLESVIVSAENADLWGLVIYAPDGYSIAKMVLDDQRHSYLIPESRKVFYCNTAEVDYFGDLIVSPERVLGDLIALIRPDVVLEKRLEEKSFKWLQEE